MEVVNPLVNHLSAFEVLELLRSRQAYYLSSGSDAVPTNVSTLLHEGIAYLSSSTFSPAGRMSEDGMRRLMEGLEPYSARGGREMGLTKAERLQICDLAPTQPVEFHLIVEECENRFSDEEVADLLDLVASTLSEPVAVEPAGQAKATVNGVKDEDEAFEEVIVAQDEGDEGDDALVQEGLGAAEERELDEVPD